MPRINGQDLFEVAKAKKSTADVLSWLGLERGQRLAALLVLRTSCVADHGGVYRVWPRGPLDDYFALIPKTDGDYTVCASGGVEVVGLSLAGPFEGLGQGVGS